jgi:phenylacetate-CoA ligase
MGSEPLRTRLRWSAYVAATASRQARLPYRSRAAIERVQARRVRAAVSHAYRHVPHYREAIDHLGMRPEDFRTAADLARLPLLERVDVQGDPLPYTSRAHPLSSYVSLSSSGTTGEPVAVYHDRYSLAQSAGHRRRREAVIRKLAGKRFRYRQILLRPQGSTGHQAQRAFDRVTLLPRWLRNERRRVSLHEPFETVIEAVNELRPDVISSVGSYVEALFLHLHRHGVRMHLPRVVTYGSEDLSDHARRLVTEEFGIPVLGFYSATETANTGFECERHRGYHVNVDYCPLRIVDPDGNDLPDGERGEVVISNLSNRGTMLLNYRLGDLASLIGEPCDCGRSLPLLSRVEANIGEWVEDAAGERVHPLAFNYVLNEEAGSIWRWRIEQRQPGELVVSVVPKEGCDSDSLRSRLERLLTERLGPGGRVAVRFADDLPRTPAGKTPYFVSSAGERSI